MTPFRRMVIATIPISLVVVLSWFGVFTFVNGYCIKQLGYSNADWARVMLWFTGAIVVWQIACTEIARLIGRVNALAVGHASVAAGFGLIALSTRPEALRLGLILIACIVAMQAVIWMSLVAQVGRRLPGRAIAAAQAMAALISVLVLLGGGYLLSIMSYRPAFMIFAGVAAACCWGFAVLAGPLEAGSMEPVVSLSRVIRYDLRNLITLPVAGILVLGAFMEPFIFHTANQLFPNLMRDCHGWSETAISSTVALGRLPMIAILFLVGLGIDRLSHRMPRVYGIGMLLGGLCVAGCGATGGAFWAAAGYFGYYIGQGIIWSSNQASFNSVIPPRLRDAAFAIFSLTMYGGIFVAGWTQAVLLSHGWSVRAVFMTCGLLAVLSAVCLLAFSMSRLIRRAGLPGDAGQ